MSVSFVVDDVDPLEHVFETKRFAELTEGALAAGGDPAWRVIEPLFTHALLGAVHLAFSKHRVLELSPDAVWLTIAEGFAEHIRLNAESLRSRLVRHQGREQLTILSEEAMPTDKESWAGIVARFRDLLAEQVGDGPAALFECDFSTSTDVDLTASRVVLMDAYSPYFDYEWVSVCGIPKIRITGTPEDWRSVRARIEVIAEFGLETWCTSLRRIADEFVSAAEGKPSRGFFKSIYKPADAYGGEIITGWIGRLYPYLNQAGEPGIPNPMLDEPLGAAAAFSGRREPAHRARAFIRSSEVLASQSRAAVEVTTVDGGKRNLELFGGVRVVTEASDGALTARASWELHEQEAPPLGRVLDRIEAEQAVRLQARPASEVREGSAELRKMAERFESFRIVAGSEVWVMPTQEQRRDVQWSGVKSSHRLGRLCLALPKRRAIVAVEQLLLGALAYLNGQRLYVLCELEQTAEEVPIDRDGIYVYAQPCLDVKTVVPVATSLAQLLTTLLDEGPEAALRPMGELSEFLPSVGEEG